MGRRSRWKTVLLTLAMTLLIYMAIWMLLFASFGDLIANAVGFNRLIGALGGAVVGAALHRWVIIPSLPSRLKRRIPQVSL